MLKIADKRAALLSAALALFAEKGLQGASTAQIARCAGVASGTLFVYFSTKEDLIHQLFQEVVGRVHGEIFGQGGLRLGTRDRFLDVLSRILRYFLANPNEFRFLEQYHFSPLFDPECKTLNGDESFKKLLVEARDQGVIKDVPLLILESIAFGTISSLAKERASRDTKVDEQMIQQVIQATWDALKR